MRRIMRLLILVSACLVLLSLAIGGWYVFSRGVVVVVSNQGTSEIKNVVVRYRSEVKETSVLSPNHQQEWKIKPTTGTDLGVGFEDSVGRKREFRLAVYFDRVSRGTIRVKAGPSGKVSWSSDVNVPNWLMKVVLDHFFGIRTLSTEEAGEGEPIEEEVARREWASS